MRTGQFRKTPDWSENYTRQTAYLVFDRLFIFYSVCIVYG